MAGDLQKILSRKEKSLRKFQAATPGLVLMVGEGFRVRPRNRPVRRGQIRGRGKPFDRVDYLVIRLVRHGVEHEPKPIRRR